MSRRQTPHAKREKSRNRRALDRAIIRAVRALGWSRDHQTGRVTVDTDSTMELIGLCLARQRA